MNDLTTVTEEPKIVTALEVARAFIIDSPEAFRKADAACVELLAMKKERQEYWKEPKAKAKAIHMDLCAKEAAEIGQVDECRAEYKKKMRAYTDAEEAKRVAAEAIAREAAAKAAEETAVQVAAQVEAHGGNGQKVLEKMMQTAPVVHVESSVPKAETKLRTIWRGRVVDPSLVPDEFWVIDEAKVNARAREVKGPSNVPGIEFYSETC